MAQLFFYCKITLIAGIVVIMLYFNFASQGRLSIAISYIQVRLIDKHANSCPQKSFDRNTTNLAYSNGNTVNLFSCENINCIQILKYLGKGYYKNVYLGIYKKQKFVLKTLRENLICKDPKSCETKFELNERGVPRSEIRLRHNNINRYVGCCTSGHDILAQLQTRTSVCVTFAGRPLTSSALADWSWQRRLAVALEWAGLMLYLQRHPTGSVRFDDFKRDNVMVVNGTIKIIDLDSFMVGQFRCDTFNRFHTTDKAHRVFCGLGIEEVEALRHEDVNSLYNLYYLDAVVLQVLLYPRCARFRRHCASLHSKLLHGLYSPSLLRDHLHHLLRLSQQEA